MVTRLFQFARCPKILFGAGMYARLPEIICGFGRRVLLVTGGHSLRSSGNLDTFCDVLKRETIHYDIVSILGEPTPEIVDEVVSEHRHRRMEAVLAVGGGSVVDAGKAVSAMLLQNGSVEDYLEGIGNPAAHSGRKVPFIAVPTTAGTGSEATKNAVLSRVGPDGFKRSLRHDNFVPDIAVLDPELALTCPPDLTAACGMDALTQLLESYVSTAASPMTDALALHGLELVKQSLDRAYADGEKDVEARAGMAWAALMSGLTLANAGLGIVHGLAGPMGGFFEIPHGVACGTLVGAATSITIRKLMNQSGPEHSALIKYAKAGALLAGKKESGITAGCEMLIERLEKWIVDLKIPRLGDYGIGESEFDKVVAAADNKNNPARLLAEEIRTLLTARL